MKVAMMLAVALAFPLHAAAHEAEASVALPVSGVAISTQVAIDPPPCRHRYAVVCTGPERVHNRRASLDRQLNHSLWQGLSQNVTRTRFIETARNSLQIAEDSVFELTHVTRDEQRAVLAAAKAELVARLSNPQGRRLFNSDPAGRDRHQRLVARLNAVTLRYGRESVENETKRREIAEPEVNALVHRANAYLEYHELCGENGLAVDSFWTEFPEYGDDPENVSRRVYQGPGADALVPCPGLVLSMADHSLDKADILNALHFAFGSQLGYIIVDEMKDVWSPRARVEACYGSGYTVDRDRLQQLAPGRDVEGMFEQIADEMAAECWGSSVLAERLQAIDSLERRARVTALALHSACVTTAPAGMAVIRFRMHQIGNTPALAAQLPGANPSDERPYCTLPPVSD